MSDVEYFSLRDELSSRLELVMDYSRVLRTNLGREIEKEQGSVHATSVHLNNFYCGLIGLCAHSLKQKLDKLESCSEWDIEQVIESLRLERSPANIQVPCEKPIKDAYGAFLDSLLVASREAQVRVKSLDVKELVRLPY